MSFLYYKLMDLIFEEKQLNFCKKSYSILQIALCKSYSSQKNHCFMDKIP